MKSKEFSCLSCERQTRTRLLACLCRPRLLALLKKIANYVQVQSAIHMGDNHNLGGMGDQEYSPSWTRPQDVMKIRKLKTQKRALQDRLFDCESPTKRTKRVYMRKFGVKTSTQPPPPEESALDDTTLMNLLGMSKETLPETPQDSSGSEASFQTNSQVKPIAFTLAPSSPPSSPVAAYLPSLCDNFGSPIKLKNRRTLTTLRPAPTSPSSFSPKSKRALRRGGPDDKSDNEEDKNWHKSLCLDWSLKTNIKITSQTPFPWSGNNLKTSEETSGTSAFVRCLDMQPPKANEKKEKEKLPEVTHCHLDTSVGAQFHQCSLYWQHPSLPTMTLFPRDGGSNFGTNNNGSVRFDQKVLDFLHLEWIDAFRSAFQLIKFRQSPFFYICSNQFTALFCAAGTQGDGETQIYVTKASKGFREALRAEGIDFSMPYFMDDNENKPESRSRSPSPDLCEPGSPKQDNNCDEEETGKWFNDLGISMGVSLLNTIQADSIASTEKDKSKLIRISGQDTQAFFNFLINSKSYLVSAGGTFSGIPPTILSPVAFYGATLKTLKVNQCKIRSKKNETLHCIDMTGPILPHIMHMLCPLLNKTVGKYRIQMKTVESTIPLNLYANVKPILGQMKQTTIFDFQNLVDCGLTKSVLDAFCKSDNCHTIQSKMIHKNLKYQWV